MRIFYVFGFISLLFLSSKAQKAKDEVIQINIEVGINALTLNWPLEDDAFAGQYEIRRRMPTDEEWGETIATVNGGTKSYVDRTVTPGQQYEYWVSKTQNNQPSAFGYMSSGIKVVHAPTKSGLIMLIDSTLIDTLKNELDQYEKDVTAEGYTVYRVFAGRAEKPGKVRRRVITAYNDAKSQVNTIFIIGHVPVAYSGDFKSAGVPPPDGHVEGSGNHTGAWPTDGFYGDMDGTWNDLNVNNITGASTRNHNIPGDGKFDHNKFVGEIELEVGRVDLYDIPAFTLYDEIGLLKAYFKRNHSWRVDEWRVTERGLIDNNFLGHNLASTGYHNLSALLPIDSVYDDRDYFTTLNEEEYLWSYGCGAGSYKSCNGIGNTIDFATDTAQTVFTILAGSYFGDWDSRGNFLRAPLGGVTLASAWGGIPKWYLHHMGMGQTIGFGTRLTQNNVDEYFSGNFNFSQNSIHIALMGDPTLRMRNVPPVSNLLATSNANVVSLSWDKAEGDFDGYFVYRIDSMGGFKLLTQEPLKDVRSFTDDQNFYTGDYEYAVYTTRLETTVSGSYYNIGGGSRAKVSHVNNLKLKPEPGISIFPNPTEGLLSIQFDDGFKNDMTLSVISVDGKTVLEKTGFVSSNQTTQLDISSLENGIYLLTIEGSETRIVKRISKL